MTKLAKLESNHKPGARERTPGRLGAIFAVFATFHSRFMLLPIL
ncbi:hypothetical protein [Pandoraea pulmonicola]|nr:hypothetical protein [Pandoraea pulmonicola]